MDSHVEETSRAKVSLRLRHPTMSAEGIVEGIGLEPCVSQAVGAPRTARNGSPLGGVYKHSYCSIEVPPVESLSDLAEAIEQNLFYLEGIGEFWERFIESGGAANYFIGLFINKMCGLKFSPELLSKLAAMRIELQFDIYPPDGYPAVRRL